MSVRVLVPQSLAGGGKEEKKTKRKGREGKDGGESLCRSFRPVRMRKRKTEKGGKNRKPQLSFSTLPDRGEEN